MKEQIQKTSERLRKAASLTVLTGAGVSAESGIPTFRDKGGIWEKFDPTEVATYDAFIRNPKFVWEWYLERMRTFQKAAPNPAHRAIALLERRVPKFTLVTQNIDDLHRKAGSQNIVELHGNVWWTKCLDCGKREALKKIPEKAPVFCAHCEGLARPDIVWFGEMLDPEKLQRAAQACQVELFMIVGTSGEVWPAAGFAHEAKADGAFLIEINTQKSELSSIADISLFGKAGEVLGELLGE
jgi:NAD-dependent deacetylase